MNAIACAVLLLAVTGAAARAWHGRRRVAPGELALTASTLLAGFVVADTQVAALTGFDGAWTRAMAVAGLVAAGGWAWRRREIEEPCATPPGTLRVLALSAVALALPLAWLPVPLDTDAQGFGHLALAVREGGTLDTFAPWRPDLAYVYAPGALVAFARASALLPWTSMPEVMLGVGHAVGLLFAAVAGPFGRELGLAVDPAPAGRGAGGGHWPAVATIAAVASLGYWTALLDAHYTSTIALAFALTWLTWSMRAWRTRRLAPLLGSAVTLAAVLVTHQDTAIIVALGAVPLGAAAVVAAPAGRRARVVASLVAIGVLALALDAPWLARLLPRLASGIASPFEMSSTHWRQLVLYQGAVWPALALLALVVRPRSPWVLAGAAWIALVVDFSMVGAIERAAPWLAAPITRFDYPFSLAWHGPILPCLLLGTVALAHLARRSRQDVDRWPTPWLAVSVAVALVAVGALAPAVTASLRRVAAWHGAFATANDVRALAWVRTHAPRDARILNYPGDFEHLRDWEGHWAPVVAERDAVFLRMQPFFLPGPALDAARREQQAMLAFWRDPSDASHLARLRAAGVAFVVAPEVLNDPVAASRWRGAPPALLEGAKTRPADARYLRLAFKAGGAEVYAVEDSARP